MFWCKAISWHDICYLLNIGGKFCFSLPEDLTVKDYFFREKGWAKREFHDVLGWVIVCFVKNHTHYNSCGRSK